jgi:FAD synthetase
MVEALAAVDEAHVGHPTDIFVPVVELDPDCIVLGHDQYHDPEEIRQALTERGVECAVERASGRAPRYEGELLSTGQIIERVLDQRGPE